MLSSLLRIFLIHYLILFSSAAKVLPNFGQSLRCRSCTGACLLFPKQLIKQEKLNKKLAIQKKEKKCNNNNNG